MKFCSACGRTLVQRIPPGDERPRHVCETCGKIHYENPRVVVGALATWEGKVLLCRRAIEPRTGFWTLPAGFMELAETTEEAAIREAWEEARAKIEVTGLLALYDLQHIDQVQVFYAARLLDPAVSPGPESQAVELFTWEAIPWQDLAFPSVHRALHYHREVSQRAAYPPDRGTSGPPRCPLSGTPDGS